MIADDDDNRDDDEDDEFHAMTSQEIDDELAEGDAAEAEQVKRRLNIGMCNML